MRLPPRRAAPWELGLMTVWHRMHLLPRMAHSRRKLGRVHSRAPRATTSETSAPRKQHPSCEA
jgi:hypothetical protein